MKSTTMRAKIWKYVSCVRYHATKTKDVPCPKVLV